MMKKIWLFSGIIATTVLMASCGDMKSGESSESTTKETQATTSKTMEQSSEKSTSKETAETKEESSTSPSNEPMDTTVTETTPESQATAVLNQLSKSFENQKLPTEILTSTTNNYLAAATTELKDQANFRILYYAENEAIKVNDTKLNTRKPIASFEKATYDTEDKAKAAVNQLTDDGGQDVDLGYNITGHQQGAAGSSFISWKEGNWQLSVRASNIEGEQAKPLATEIVEWLETKMLPAPKSIGQITLNVGTSTDYQKNTVVWQDGKTTYTITHFDPMQAIKMATSMK